MSERIRGSYDDALYKLMYALLYSTMLNAVVLSNALCSHSLPQLTEYSSLLCPGFFP